MSSMNEKALNLLYEVSSMLTLTTAQQWLDEFALAINKHKEYLSELDLAIGDGDHGGNMVRGVEEYNKQIESNPPKSITDLLNLMGMSMISKVGGSSGQLYGSAFVSMSKASVGKEELNYDEIVELLEKGFQGIQRVGKIQVGDKTMLDMWSPAVEYLKMNKLTVDVIEKIKQETATLQAKKGRASYLGERSIGHIDPGAASSSLLFKALLEVI